MKIVNFKKFVRGIIIILGIILMLSLLISKSSFSHVEVKYEKFYVEEGDTLWQIATKLQKNNSYYSNKDIRYIVDDLITINELKTNILYENQELNIPVI